MVLTAKQNDACHSVQDASRDGGRMVVRKCDDLMIAANSKRSVLDCEAERRLSQCSRC